MAITAMRDDGEDHEHDGDHEHEEGALLEDGQHYHRADIRGIGEGIIALADMLDNYQDRYIMLRVAVVKALGFCEEQDCDACDDLEFHINEDNRDHLVVVLVKALRDEFADNGGVCTARLAAERNVKNPPVWVGRPGGQRQDPRTL